MNRVTGGFSHGMGRRLSVVLAAMHEPQVLLLDEPFDGVDPIGVEATFEVIADARARGATILLSTHLRDLAIQACGSVAGAARRLAGRRGRRRGDGRRGGGTCLPRSPRLTRHASYVAASGLALAPAAPSVRRRDPLPASARRPYAVATCPAACRLVFLASPWRAAIVPAFMPGAHGAGKAFDIFLLTAVGDGRHPGPQRRARRSPPAVAAS